MTKSGDSQRNIESAVGDFLGSLDAVRELSNFASEHAGTLDDEFASAVNIACQQMPHLDRKVHEQAMTLMDAVLNSPHETNKGNDIFAEMIAQIEGINKTPNSYVNYFLARVEAGSRPQRLPLLYASLLTTAVSSFEVLISQLVRAYFHLRPAALRGDDSKYSITEIEAFGSFTDFRDYAIDRYADNLLRGGLEDWLAWFKRQLKIDETSIIVDGSILREVFQRRHLFVHNGGVVNASYLSKLAGGKDLPSAGSKLTVDKDYCLDAIDALNVTGVLLCSAMMLKLIKHSEEEDHPGDKLIVAQSYHNLLLGRYHCVLAMVSHHLKICESEDSKLLIQVNGWIARKRLDGAEAIKKEVEAWRVTSLEGRFKLAKLALLDKHEEASTLGKELRDRNEIRFEDWSSWPLLSEVRVWEAEKSTKQT